MTVKTIVEEVAKEQVVDNISDVKMASSSEELANDTKLVESRPKNQTTTRAKKNEPMKPDRSFEFGILGLGQCGSRLAQAFYEAKYEKVLAVNTAMQDLKGIQVPDGAKLLLEQPGGLRGSARELSLGEAAAQLNKDKILAAVDKHLADAQVFIVASSLAGGTGSGAICTVIDMLNDHGYCKPIVVIVTLPLNSEDVEMKRNSLETLQKLLEKSKTKQIANLIVADNAKLESVLSNVSQIDFFPLANKAIIKPLDIFNVLSVRESEMKPFDTTEFLKLLVSEGITIYGELTVKNYTDDLAIAEAIMNSLSNNLLAGGFDIKQTKYAAMLVCANRKVWQAIASSSTDSAVAELNEQCGHPLGVYKGYYVCDEMEDDVVKVYSMFAGLGIPTSRLTPLQEEVKKAMGVVKNKTDARDLTLTLDLGEKTISDAQKVRDKIIAKNSTFGKMTGGISDRRK